MTVLSKYYIIQKNEFMQSKQLKSNKRYEPLEKCFD